MSLKDKASKIRRRKKEKKENMSFNFFLLLISELESVENDLIFSKRFSHEATTRADEML